MNVVRRRYLIMQGAWIRYRLRHRRKSELQRDWESGDPARVARVQALADRIVAELDAEE